jgi:FkbM family methyltransferase
VRHARSYARFCRDHVPGLVNRLRFLAAYPAFYINARRTSTGRWRWIATLDAPTRCLTFDVDMGRRVTVTVPRRHDALTTFEQVFVKEEYWPRGGVRRARTLVDLGANFGIVTSYLVSRLPFERVLAVEPNPLCEEVLARNLRCRPGLHAERVTALVADQDDRHGRLALGTNFLLSWAAEYAFDDRPTTRVFEDVPRVRLSTLLRDHGIEAVDLLKMDIEFAEHDVTRADAEALARCACIVAEVHGKARQREELLDQWRALGFEVRNRRSVTPDHEVVEAHLAATHRSSRSSAA